MRIIEVEVSGTTYGYQAFLDDDFQPKLNSLGPKSKIFKWQEYTTRNKRVMRRRIRVPNNTAIHPLIVQAFLTKYKKENIHD